MPARVRNATRNGWRQSGRTELMGFRNGLALLLIAAAAGLVLWTLVEPDPSAPEAGASAGPSGDPFTGDYLLAVSWQPAFCETRPDKPECTSQTANRFDATHFTLHGLWPQPEGNFYCGVDADLAAQDRQGRWSAVGELNLNSETRAELDTVMPGTQSLLQRHEWIKHGTCTGGTPESYYRLSLDLMETLNGSGLQTLFGDHAGGTLTVEQVRNAMTQAFGAGAGERVSLECVTDGDRRLISSVRIALTDPANADLAGAMQRAAPRSPGCPSGEVDTVGLQ